MLLMRKLVSMQLHLMMIYYISLIYLLKIMEKIMTLLYFYKAIMDLILEILQKEKIEILRKNFQFFFLLLIKGFYINFHALHENTHRLILKQDLRETMLSIAGISEKSNESINLLSEIALKSRDCKNISISEDSCVCSNVEEYYNYTTSHLQLFEKLKSYAESEINSFAYSHKDNFLGRICKKITLDKITSILHFQLNNVNELYSLSITSSTRKNMEFKIDFFLASDNKRMNMDKNLFRIVNLNYKYYPIKIRVSYR